LTARKRGEEKMPLRDGSFQTEIEGVWRDKEALEDKHVGEDKYNDKRKVGKQWYRFATKVFLNF
jgi:hypothetical protein